MQEVIFKMATGSAQPHVYPENIKQLHFDEWAGDVDGTKKINNLDFTFIKENPRRIRHCGQSTKLL